MHNKRNYYRILHVQFDAPPAVIKASYRTIMQKLRAHPDLGGEEWNASLINEARKVLLDPALRAAYDRQLRDANAATEPSSDRKHTQSNAGGRPQPQPHPQHDSTQSERADDTARHASGSSKSELKAETLIPNLRLRCPFCDCPIPQNPSRTAEYSTAHRCARCEAPLKKVENLWLTTHKESRKINRTEFDQLVNVWNKWPSSSSFEASVCDWSTSGCCIQMEQAIKIGTVILLRSPVFDAIATVRYQSPETFYGLEFLTLEVNMSPGTVFVSSA